jgi:hypothetical protein
VRRASSPTTQVAWRRGRPLAPAPLAHAMPFRLCRWPPSGRGHRSRAAPVPPRTPMATCSHSSPLSAPRRGALPTKLRAFPALATRQDLFRQACGIRPSVHTRAGPGLIRCPMARVSRGADGSAAARVDWAMVSQIVTQARNRLSRAKSAPSSKPAGRGSPTVGRFDSCAAPLLFSGTSAWRTSEQTARGDPLATRYPSARRVVGHGLVGRLGAGCCRSSSDRGRPRSCRTGVPAHAGACRGSLAEVVAGRLPLG